MSFSFFFFFKQKTAYEMRISDWSSDVCSSDLLTLAASAVVAMLTAACGTSYRDNNDPVPSDAPVISYRYVDSEDRALAAEFADNYCEEAYGKAADEFDTDREPGGYEVSFACR